MNKNNRRWIVLAPGACVDAYLRFYRRTERSVFGFGECMEFKELADNLGLEEDEFKELLELFVETSKAELEVLKLAVTRKDAQQAAVPAHSVKGAAGNLGLNDIYETALLVEKRARQDSLDGALDAVQKLQAQIDQVADAL